MHVVIETEPGHYTITGVTFLTYARKYLSAAESLASSGPGFDPVVFHLLCQAVELYLKAFIWLKEGSSAGTIKAQYGHDLQKLWRHSKSRGLQRYATVTPRRELALQLVAPYYGKRQFAYCDLDMILSGYSRLSRERHTLPTLKGLARRLEKTLRRPVLAAS
jgi:HEPN domain-containing protein